MKITSSHRAIHLLCAVLIMGLPFCGVARATDYTWTGNVNGDWNVFANWSSNAMPASSVNTDLIFGPAGAGGTTLNNNINPSQPFGLNSIIINSNAPGYTIGGNTFDFSNSNAAAAPQIILNSSAGLTLNNPAILTSSLTVSNLATGGLVLAGPISGPGGITLNAGSAFLVGSNTFAGPINVNNATLIFGGIGTGATSIPTGGNVNVGAGGALVPFFGSNNTAATAKGTITLNANGTFVVPPLGDFFINRLNINGGPGTPTLDASRDEAILHFVNFSANVNVGGNATWLGSATSSIVNDTTAPMDINVSNGTLTSSIRLANGASGQGFQVNGNGTIALTNLGNTANLAVANGATISVTDMAYLGTGSLSVADSAPGTIQYAGDSATSAKPIALGIRGGTIFVSKPGTNLTLSGVISGSSSGQPLIIRGAPGGSTITLAANNTYTGPTIISGGAVLSIDSIANGSIPSPIGASTAIGPFQARSNLVIGGGPAGGSGTLRYTGPTATTDRFVAFADASIEVSDPSTNLTISGETDGPGPLRKLGPGTLTLENVGNWGGGTFINAGRLVINIGALLPRGKDVTVNGGGELTCTGQIGPTFPLGNLFLNDGVVRASGICDLYLNKLTTDFHGGTVITGGTSSLNFSNTGASISVSGNSTWIGDGGTLRNQSGARVDLIIAPSVTLTNPIPFFGDFRVTGGGTLYQTAPVVNPFPLTIDHGTLRVDNPSNIPGTAVTLTDGTLQYSGPSGSFGKSLTLAADGTFDVSNPTTSLTFNSTLTGPGRFIKTGLGTLTIPANTNTFSGGITIDNGTIETSFDDRLGTAPIIINPRGILRYMSTTSTSRTFNLNGGTIDLPTARTLTFDGASISGGFLRGVGFFRAGGNASFAGTTALAGTQIDQFGPASLANFTNSGFLQSSAPLTWNGGSNTGAGHLTVSSTLTTSAFENNGVINIQSGGIWTHTDNFLTSTGGSRITVNPGGTITLLGNQLDLNGALLINNGTINGTTSVNFGSLAKGSGVYGPVNVTDGGRFSPGNSPGSVTTGATSWNSGGSYIVEIADALAGAGVGWDEWNINGILNLNATNTTNGRFTISLSTLDAIAANFDNTHDYDWPILHADGGIAGFDASEVTLDSSGFKNNLSGGHFSLDSTPTNLIIHFAAVPEPVSMALFAFVGLFAAHRGRFRR